MSYSTRHSTRFVCLVLSALFFRWYFFSQLVQRLILALRNDQRGNRRTLPAYLQSTAPSLIARHTFSAVAGICT
jgi:hypothetical protein